MTQCTSTPSPTTPAELKTLYPYQFAGKSIELSFMRGWFSLFANTCRQVDDILGEDKRGFHWIQLKEKFGSARWYWTITDKARKADPDLNRRLMQLVADGTAKTDTACIACGSPGELDTHGGYHLVLCPTHAEQRKVEPESMQIIWLDDNTPGV